MNNISDFCSEYLEYNEFHQDLIKKQNYILNYATLTLIKSFLKQIFENNKEIKTMGWVQFKLSDNFNVFKESPLLNNHSKFYNTGSFGEPNKKEIIDFLKDNEKILNEIQKFLEMIPDENLKSLFGVGKIIFDMNLNHIIYYANI